MNYANIMFEIKYIITFLSTISYIITQTDLNIYYSISMNHMDFVMKVPHTNKYVIFVLRMSNHNLLRNFE